jgi:hypothetical protein
MPVKMPGGIDSHYDINIFVRSISRAQGKQTRDPILGRLCLIDQAS